MISSPPSFLSPHLLLPFLPISLMVTHIFLPTVSSSTQNNFLLTKVSRDLRVVSSQQISLQSLLSKVMNLGLHSPKQVLEYGQKVPMLARGLFFYQK